MKSIFVLALIKCIVLSAAAQADTPSRDMQIKLAVLAAPMDMRDSCTVLGTNASGEYVVLRQGSNGIICLADDPKTKGFNVSCYHQNLELFMQRGRDLKMQGKSAKEIFDTREQEVKTGKLVMNKEPSTLYAYSAKAEDYDSIAGSVKNGYLRYVIYIPYATSKSTGLPLKPDEPGMPWIMDPGTHRAHIMINPEPKK
jgi:hypothetical protein